MITGRIASYHFSPTPLSRQNLLDEGVKESAIIVTGNTVIDALYMVVDKIKSDKRFDEELKGILKTAGYDINRLLDGKKLVFLCVGLFRLLQRNIQMLILSIRCI